MLHTFGSSYVARVSGNRKGCNLGVFFVVAAMELRPPYPLWRRQTLPFFLCCRLTGKETVCEKTVFLKWSILQVCVWCVGLHMLVCCGIHDNFFLNDPSCRCACGVWVCTCLCAVASMTIFFEMIHLAGVRVVCGSAHACVLWHPWQFFF